MKVSARIGSLGFRSWTRPALGAVLLLFAVVAGTDAQTGADREAVLATVQTFFDTMTARDVEGARRVMVPDGRFYAMEMRKPTTALQSFTSEEYFGRLQRSQRTNRERIWNPEVRVHGLIATVWAPYDLWTDGKFSHCGVDAFDLIKTAEGWKISGGAFTMESACEPSPLGPLKQ
jgi:hypothetical protein